MGVIIECIHNFNIITLLMENKINESTDFH